MVSASDAFRQPRAAEGLCVVGASAGSGKTHHLTQVVVEALEGRRAVPLDIESLVAVTYTTRAAAELRSRIRQELVRQGASESALRLPLARLGTVHAVCFSWLQDFAIDAGLPPGVQVLPEDGGVQFRRLLEASIPAELQARLSKLAKGLQLNWDGMRSRTDWLWRVFELIDLARANRISAQALPEMAARSAAQMAELLPPRSHRDLDAALLAALERAEQDLDAADDRTRATKGVRADVKAIGRRLKNGWASWKDWATLAALTPAKKSKELVAQVSEIAAGFEAHPRFQDEVNEMIHGVFECARVGLERYQSHKARLRLVDYVDMLEHALALLDRPEIAAELEGRLRLLVVDEFQDTSPIQLELFLRLHRLTRRSTWVGDRKQCIFEFAGADPQLMDSVARWVTDNGGDSHQLPHNYRSRPELVQLCSELFAAALEPHGYTRAEVVVTARRETPPELDRLPPAGIFALSATNADQTHAAIARGVQRLLATPEETPVVDRQTQRLRPLQAGDIAVLVRTNAEAEAIARELGRLQMRAALARPGLLLTPEGTLIDAAISYLVDRGDGVASATLDALHGFGGSDPDQWLSERVRGHHERKDAAAKKKTAAHLDATDEPPEAAEVPETAEVPEAAEVTEVPEAAEPPEAAEAAEVADDVTLAPATSGWRAALDALARQPRQMSPRETIDAVLQALDVERLVLGWPDPEQRSGNLDALRALADHYEDTCRITGAAASLAGLLYYFDRARESRWNGSEVRASDEQHFSPGSGAVVLCTYHRAKGLEWPVVILASLDAAARADAFGVKIQAPDGPLDPEHPLHGRWIRYLPRPLTGQSKNIGFVERERQSAQGTQARQDERLERARLLYVGCTRARDHLIFAARNRDGELAAHWLDELCDANGAPLLQRSLASETEESAVAIRGTQTRLAARLWHIALEPSPTLAVNDTAPVLTWRRPPQTPARGSYWMTPSSAAECWPGLPRLCVAELVRIAAPVPVRRTGDVDWAAFGDTVHAFLAADRREDEHVLRLVRARRLLSACSSGANLEPESLIGVSDALFRFVAERWPGAVWHRELPIRVKMAAESGARQVNGAIDLLLETSDGYVVIDHKTYGNPDERAIREHAEQYLPQLAAYGQAIDALGGRRVSEYWLHFGLGGVGVRCSGCSELGAAD